MNRVSRACMVILAVGLGGCSAVAVDPNASFPQVSQLVTECAGKEITWTPGTEESSPTLEAINDD